MTSSTRTSLERPRLALSVRHADGRSEDFFVKQRLSVGRDPSNTIVLDDADGMILRVHAEVASNENGAFVFRCFDEAQLRLPDGRTVTTLELIDNTTFFVGTAEFECQLFHSSKRSEPAAGATLGTSTEGTEPSNPSRLNRQACPHCSTAELPDVLGEPTVCVGCGELIIIAARSKEDGGNLILPVEFDGYRVWQVGARGGMGILLQVQDAKHKKFAIKLLAVENESARRRFDAEYEALAKVDHPCVLKVIGRGTVAGFQYLVMPWMGGRTLQDVVRESQNSRPSFTQLRRWFVDVCDGLAAIHSSQLVHRDIKPSNILLTANNRAVVADLGISKSLEDVGGETTTALAPGTYDYMAPEQAANATVDPRADQYSLGVTFYEVATGRRPKGSWLRASSLNSRVPPYFDTLLERLLQYDRSDRFPNVADVRDSLMTFHLREELTAVLGKHWETPSLSVRLRRGKRRMLDQLTRLGLLVCANADDAEIPLIRTKEEDRWSDGFYIAFCMAWAWLILWALVGLWPAVILTIVLLIPLFARVALRIGFGSDLSALFYTRHLHGALPDRDRRVLAGAAIRSSRLFLPARVARIVADLTSGRTRQVDDDLVWLLKRGAFGEAAVLGAIRYAREGDDATAQTWLSLCSKLAPGNPAVSFTEIVLSKFRRNGLLIAEPVDDAPAAPDRAAVTDLYRQPNFDSVCRQITEGRRRKPLDNCLWLLFAYWFQDNDDIALKRRRLGRDNSSSASATGRNLRRRLPPSLPVTEPRPGDLHRKLERMLAIGSRLPFPNLDSAQDLKREP